MQAFFDRWVRRLSRPLTPADRAAGYAHRLTIWQLAVSLTHVFRQPLWGRRVFEAVIRAKLDLGRPDQVSLLFPIHRTRRTPSPLAGYRTRVITAGVIPRPERRLYAQQREAVVQGLCRAQDYGELWVEDADSPFSGSLMASGHFPRGLKT